MIVMDVKVIGYFVDIDGDKTSANDVFVAIDEPADYNGNITIYAPIGQHGAGSREYVKECEEITKEEYINASKGFYTPPDYL